MNSKFFRLLAVCLLAEPLSAQAGVYFVRANMVPMVELHVDSQTSVTRNINTVNGHAFGSASLARGALQALSDHSPSGASSLTSWVDFGDTITINGVTAPTEIAVQMHVTGTISGLVPQVFAQLLVGDSFSCTSTVCQVVNLTIDQSFWDSSCCTGPVDDILSIQVPVTPTDHSFVFLGRLIALTNPPDGFADFGQTAQLGLILPDGLSFSSASGVLLTSVPEPTTLALLCLGLVGLAASRRRKQ